MQRNAAIVASVGLDNLLKKLAAHGSDGCILPWVNTGWMVEPRAVINGLTSTWDKSLVVFPRAQFWEYAD